jgi:hypothetical protein
MYCLLGVDHVSAPRTFAHVLAIQRTEMYEWARVMAAQGAGNHMSSDRQLFINQ